jgi:hypothetical protein
MSRADRQIDRFVFVHELSLAVERHFGGTRLNRLTGGWSAYFDYGTLNAAYREVDRHVCDRVRDFLSRRAKRGGRGAREFSWNDVFGKLGVQRLTRDKTAAPP